MANYGANKVIRTGFYPYPNEDTGDPRGPEQMGDPKEYARGGLVRRRTGYSGGGEVGEEAYTDYGKAPSKDVNTELDRYYKDQLEGHQARVKPNTPQDDDTVYGGTAPRWSEAAYNASLTDATGYAQGGEVRQNFEMGGWATKAQRAKEAAKLAERQHELDAMYGPGEVDAATGEPPMSKAMASAAQGARNAAAGIKPYDPGIVQGTGPALPSSTLTREASHAVVKNDGGTPITPKNVKNDGGTPITPKNVTSNTSGVPQYDNNAGETVKSAGSPETGYDSKGNNYTAGDYGAGRSASAEGGGGEPASRSLDVTSFDGGGSGGSDTSTASTDRYAEDRAASERVAAVPQAEPQYAGGGGEQPQYAGGGEQPQYSGGGGGGGEVQYADAGGGGSDSYAGGGLVRRNFYEGGEAGDESEGLDTRYRGNTEAQDAILREREREAREQEAYRQNPRSLADPNAPPQPDVQTPREAPTTDDTSPVRHSEPPVPPGQQAVDDLRARSTPGEQPPIGDRPPAPELQDAKEALRTVLEYGRKSAGLISENRGDTGYNQAGDPPPMNTGDPSTAPAQTGYGQPDEMQAAQEARDAAAARLGQRGSQAAPMRHLNTASPDDRLLDKAEMTVGRIGEDIANKFKEPSYAIPPDRDKQGVMGQLGDMGEKWAKYLRGDNNPMPTDKLMGVIHSDPKGDYNKPIQDTFSKLVADGKIDEAHRLEQGLRKPYDVVRGAGQAAIDAGDVPNAMRAAERMHNMLPDGMRMTVSQARDGNFIVSMTPEQGFKGEPSSHNLSPQQFRSFMFSDASQFDHAADNGIARNLDIMTQPKFPMPATGMQGAAPAPLPQATEGELNAPRQRGGAATGPRAEADPGVAGSQMASAGTSDATDFGAVRRGGRAAPAPAPAPAQPAPAYYPQQGGAPARGAAPAFAPGAGGASYPVPQSLDLQTTGYEQPEPVPRTGKPFPGGNYDPIQGKGPFMEAERAPRPQKEAVGAPGSMQGVPKGLDAPLTREELAYTSKMPDRSIQKDPDLLQRLPEGYFDTAGGKAAIERIAREEATRGGRYPAGANGREQIARDLLSLYNPARGAAPAGAEGGSGMIGPAAPDPSERVGAMTGSRKENYKLGNPNSAGDVQAYNDRIDRFNQTGDMAQSERGRQFEAKVAPQFGAAQERSGREETAKISAREKSIAENNAKDQTARIEARDPQLVAHRRALELQGEKNQPGFARADATRDAAEIRSNAILTKTDRDNLAKGERQQVGEGGKDRRLDTTEGGKDRRLDITEGGKNARQTEREQGRDRRLDTTEGGKDRRLEYTHKQLNDRAERVAAQKDQHLDFLKSKAAADIEQKYVQGDAKQAMNTIRTKIPQGIKLNEQEMDVYQQVLDRAGNAPQTGGLFPALDGLRNPENRIQGTPAQEPPVQVRTPEEAAKLPKGTRFIAPDGRTGTT